MVRKLDEWVRQYEGKPIIYFWYTTRRANRVWFEAKGEKKCRAGQLWDWLTRKRVTSFEEMK